MPSTDDKVYRIRIVNGEFWTVEHDGGVCVVETFGLVEAVTAADQFLVESSLDFLDDDYLPEDIEIVNHLSGEILSLETAKQRLGGRS